MEVRINNRQRAFCRYYVESYNGTEAAIKAGYAPKCVSNTVTRLLRDPAIMEVIRAAEKESWDAAHLSKSEALKILSDFARSGITAVMNDDGMIDPKKIMKSGQIVKEYVENVSYDKDGNRTINRKVKLVDQRAAIVDISKMCGWNEPERVEEELTINVKIKDKF